MNRQRPRWSRHGAFALKSCGRLALQRRRNSGVLPTPERVLADRLVAARETAAQEKEALDAANKDYNTMFGGVNAAKHALTQQAAADRLGATPDSIVRQMETLNVEDRNFAYGEWFKKPGMTDEVKQALLQSRWQAQFKTETGGMRVPSVEEAQAFLSNTENQAFFRTYYPDYYKDITMITSALEKAQEVAKLRPHTDVNVGNILHTGMAELRTTPQGSSAWAGKALSPPGERRRCYPRRPHRWVPSPARRAEPDVL